MYIGKGFGKYLVFLGEVMVENKKHIHKLIISKKCLEKWNFLTDNEYVMNFFLFFSMRSWEEKLVANGSLYIFQFFWQRQFRMFIFKMLLVGFWIWHLGLQKISQKHYGLFHL